MLHGRPATGGGLTAATVSLILDVAQAIQRLQTTQLIELPLTRP
jgi:hypothetical protein